MSSKTTIQASGGLARARHAGLARARGRQVGGVQGDSTSRRNLLFTVVKPSSFQIRTKIYIFLAGNASEEAPDFVIRGSYIDGACTVSPGNSDATIAQASVIFQLQNHAMFHAIFIRFGIELIMQMDGLHTIPYHMKWAPMPLLIAA